MVTKSFVCSVPEDGASEMPAAARFDIPKGTVALAVSGTIHLPAARPDGGIVSVIGIRAGDREGKRKLLCELTVGRKGQWRLAGDMTSPEQAGSRKLIEWGDSVDFSLEWSQALANGRVLLSIDGRPSVEVKAFHHLLDGGALFLGMDVRDPSKREYVPMYGSTMEGEIRFEVDGEVKPPAEDGESELVKIARSLQEMALRIIDEAKRLRS
jgi:hypothetical protein